MATGCQVEVREFNDVNCEGAKIPTLFDARTRDSLARQGVTFQQQHYKQTKGKRLFVFIKNEQRLSQLVILASFCQSVSDKEEPNDCTPYPFRAN